MSMPTDQEFIAASLAAMALPHDADTVAGVAVHAARLAGMSQLVMDVALPDSVEVASTFEP